jgi:HSP20 family protein
MCYGKAYHHKWAHHPRHHHSAKKARRQGWRGHQFWNQPPVNIQELDDRYELWLFAAGYQKADFQVHLKDDTLLIRVVPQEGELVDTDNWRRREFRPTQFERQFELNDKIDRDAISAKYEDGILKLTLSKKAGMESQSQDVIVA